MKNYSLNISKILVFSGLLGIYVPAASFWRSSRQAPQRQLSTLPRLRGHVPHYGLGMYGHKLYSTSFNSTEKSLPPLHRHIKTDYTASGELMSFLPGHEDLYTTITNQAKELLARNPYDKDMILIKTKKAFDELTNELIATFGYSYAWLKNRENKLLESIDPQSLWWPKAALGAFGLYSAKKAYNYWNKPSESQEDNQKEEELQ